MAHIIDSLVVETSLDAPTSATTTADIAAAVAAHAAAADPHPTYETSAEAQAKVNAHANLTNNPHGVTKAQVGLGSADNTSDANKPVSGPQQTALNGKANLTGGNAFTGLQTYSSTGALIRCATYQPFLGQTVDTIVFNNQGGSPQSGVGPNGDIIVPNPTSALFAANKQYVDAEIVTAKNRASHTGTQTSNTISDFAATVLATVLAGYTTGAAAALTSADTILVAFGKIQGMINSLTSAIATKYDASNPSGYQTAAQVTSTVSSASTNDRNRANHTGTQLSNTVSDFAATTLATVLAGLSLATNAVISASDTVLSALGKLQAQLTQAVSDVNATFAVVNGRLDVLEATDAEWIELIKTSADQLNGSNTTLANVTDLAFTAVAGRTYLCEYTILYRTQATTTGIAITIGTSNGAAGDMRGQINIPIAADGTAALYTGNFVSLGDLVISTGVQTSVTNFVLKISAIFICTTGGTILPQFRSEVNGSNAAVAVGSVALVREFTP